MDGEHKEHRSQDHHVRHHKSHTDEAMQADIKAAHEAYEAWKSHDPRAWDFAQEEKAKIIARNPKAWRRAMKEIDAEEEQKNSSDRPEEQEPERQDPRSQAEAASRRMQDEAMERRRLDEDRVARRVAPAQPTIDVPEPVHPGYAPQSKYAPQPPDSPAYDAAYNRPQPRFYGLDLGIVKLGVNSNGSLDAGVNIGIARAEVQAGLENRVEGEFMPIGGPLHARAGAGIGVGDGGIHSEVGVGANVFNVVNGDADFGARLGRNTGVDGDVRGRVWPVNAQGDAGAGIGPDGINAYAGGNTDIADAAGVRTGAHFDLNSNSGAAAGVGLKAGDHTIDIGPSVETYGNRQVKPDFHLDSGTADDPTFYPTGDRQIDER